MVKCKMEKLSICSKWNDKTEYVFIASNLENSLAVSSNINHMLTIQPNQSWIFTQNKQKHMSTEELEDEGSQWLYLQEPQTGNSPNVQQQVNKQTVVHNTMESYSAIKKMNNWHTQWHGWVKKKKKDVCWMKETK